MIGLLIKSTILWDLFSLFPAYAGVILCVIFSPVCIPAFPRIRGGDPDVEINAQKDGSFSLLMLRS